MSPLRLAVLASGGGSNFQALLDHSRRRGPRAAWLPVLLVSDREEAGALERARAAGVDTAVAPVRGRSPADVARETLALLEDRGVDALLLAGYLRLVPPEVVRRYHGRILNIHPALLPAFGGAGMYGLHVHRAVIEAGVRVTGATVHLVDEEYDRGTILAQWPVPVLPGDTPEVLAARVLSVEHRLYPRAVDHASATWSCGKEPGPLTEPGEVFRLDRVPRNDDLSEIEKEAS